MDPKIKEMLRPKFDLLNGNDTTIRTLEISFLSSIVGAGTSAIILAVNPQTLGEAALRTGALTATCAAVGAIFATTTGATASYRGKDTPLNYFIGGCTSGLFLGARMQSMGVGSGSCAALGGAAAFYKYWKIHDFGPFIPRPKY
ncbi:NADH dehydrogenase [ubiquinone] 1 alpha subcomplex subunit 11 [Strongylocentrotus purpuratus]|uniref:NADH dehydrogenase [ubiquinone] 1 alpha subcomplex subunit 11 n=1 Tax=Strongylocentrotus purpuratus TaxID=7668 RepID=A0A7M7PCZ7_STRPU|nr:NADH dehydrogenase [ubiquinone] 1 alpha subcomplex subunit 11-like [Strongylocentrotus purpuratus]XP_788406.1 NADH dehydrogenase [ubiquinone] 1 alpha subcomplex subunit 11 [Strongylocentrotus purpuratus]|eukprot:XP_788406.1 PREDICTED: NADH dehydrogenase [ubiquinone] 1 alpha subcomplex subunit 11 [Strongylocentrotus purpuratus]